MMKLSFALLVFCVSATFVPAATFTVTTTNDVPVSGTTVTVNTNTGVISNGPGNGLISLRSAVIAANANPGSTISVPAGTYTLTIAGDDGSTDPDPTIGDLDVLASVTITGAGSSTTIIQAGTNATNGIDQLFNLNAYVTSAGQTAVTSGFSAKVTGITFRNGRCVSVDNQSDSFVGGAFSFDGGYNNGNFISSPGSLTVSNCVFDSCSTSDGPGGAIGVFDGGTIKINNTVFTSNVANATNFVESGGALYVASTPNPCSVVISNCAFVNNHSFGPGGAIALLGGGQLGPASFAIHNSQILSNTAEGEGGGVSLQDGIFTIDQGSIVSSNTSMGSIVATVQLPSEGGGLSLLNPSVGESVTISNCTIIGNSVITNFSSQAGGGGIAMQQGNATVVNCRIVGNTSTNGSGLFKDDESGTVTAINNWWGSNGGPGAPGSDTVATNAPGIANFTPFLQLAFSASPTNILFGQIPSTLTATIKGGGVTNAGIFAPNGTPIIFTATFGSPTPGTNALVSGSATSTVFGNSSGPGSASAAIDNQTNSVSVTVNLPPTITSATNATFLVGSNGAFAVAATGYPAPAVSETGTLPNGVAFDTNTDLLSGIPAAGTGGKYPIVFKATNITAINFSQNFTLTVNQPAAVTCPADIQTNSAVGTGQSVSFAATATGFPAPSVTYSLGGTPIASPFTFPLGTSVVTTTAANSTGTNMCSFNVVVVPGTPPQLTILPLGTNVVISWPVIASSYTLQTSTNLAGNNWSNYAGGVVTNGSVLLTTNSVIGEGLFYRLAH